MKSKLKYVIILLLGLLLIHSYLLLLNSRPVSEFKSVNVYGSPSPYVLELTTITNDGEQKDYFYIHPDDVFYESPDLSKSWDRVGEPDIEFDKILKIDDIREKGVYYHLYDNENNLFLIFNRELEVGSVYVTNGVDSAGKNYILKFIKL